MKEGWMGLGSKWPQKKKQRWQQRRRRGWEMRAEGWEARTGAGARDTSASQAPGMFFLFVFYITNVYITDLHWYPTTAMKEGWIGMGSKQPQKKDKDNNKEGNEVGRWGQRVGRWGQGQHRCFIYYTNVYITDLHWYPTTVIKANRQKKKGKDDNEEGNKVGRWGQRVGRQGQGQGQGLEMQTRLKPQVRFFSMFFIYSSNFILQWNATWQWQQGLGMVNEGRGSRCRHVSSPRYDLFLFF